MKHPEYELQKSVCKYLNLKYPNVLYMSDTIANVKLNMMQAVRNKAIQKDGFKCPDLLIFYPNGTYCGLFIELKVKSPYKLNGELKKDPHLQGQQSTINTLNLIGYKALFCTGIDEAIKTIDEYFNKQ
jgi:hypothetical protein